MVNCMYLTHLSPKEGAKTYKRLGAAEWYLGKYWIQINVCRVSCGGVLNMLLVLSITYHYQFGSIHLPHCYHIFPWLCAWDVCYIIFCPLLHMRSGKTRKLFSLLLCSLWCVQIFGYVWACLIWRHWTYKMPIRYILSSVWVRLSIFSSLSIIQYVGLYVLSLPISLVMIERIYILCLIIIIKWKVWTITHCQVMKQWCPLYVFLYSYDIFVYISIPVITKYLTGKFLWTYEIVCRVDTTNYAHLSSCLIKHRI